MAPSDLVLQSSPSLKGRTTVTDCGAIGTHTSLAEASPMLPLHVASYFFGHSRSDGAILVPCIRVAPPAKTPAPEEAGSLGPPSVMPRLEPRTASDLMDTRVPQDASRHADGLQTYVFTAASGHSGDAWHLTTFAVLRTEDLLGSSPPAPHGSTTPMSCLISLSVTTSNFLPLLAAKG